ncbi:M14 family zinc carboxypeptidase [Paenibacillus validus]|uniref:M14 family zinc carboxypeptidase n=1 Tax=Paenibacillus validus TaxID=44253 RepID=UPI003D270F89
MTFPYVVRRGDTWERIAQRHGLQVQALIRANTELQKGGGLQPGCSVRIPNVPDCRYIVQAGDTLAELAGRFQIGLSDLMEANPDVNPRYLRIGQTVRLPVCKAGPIVETTVPFGYQEMMRSLELLGYRYPFLEIGSIGQSVMGKDIPYVRIGCGMRHLHYNGSFHANEWVTSLLLMKFTEDYANACVQAHSFCGSDAGRLLEETSLWIVPMVNPDGVELVLHGADPDHPHAGQLLEWNGGSDDFSGWKANVRGVDLNDQFPAYWETERDRRDVPGPGPRDYTGPSPLSEPEASAMERFTRERDFRLVMAFHTQGREIYWNYRDYEPAESERIAQRFQQISGYAAVKLTGSDAGYKDWFIQTYGRPGFTIEAGYGVNPLPLSQFPIIYDELLPLLTEGLMV